MRTIEEIKEEIRDTKDELSKLKDELSGLEFLGANKCAYKHIQDKISQIQNEINKDILYIKNVYNQLLTIKSSAELLVRLNNNQEAIETSQKVHGAFLLLIEFNKKLDDKLAKRNTLLEECNHLIKKSKTKLPTQITETQEKLWALQKELINTERQESISEKATSRIIEELQTYQKAVSPIEELESQIKEKNEKLNSLCIQSNNNALRCIQCQTKMDLYIDYNKKTAYYVCPKNKEILDKKLKHTTRPCSDKESFKNILNEREILKQKKAEKESNITIKKPAIALTKKEIESFQNASIQIGEYPEIIAEKYQNLVADEHPNILTTDYKNYLFQSLAVPVDISIKDHFDELLKYSRFRIFTNLPATQVISDRERTVYSLALRLLNRGVVLNTNKKTESKIKRYFENRSASVRISRLNEYIHYTAPQIQHDSPREVAFAQHYFPLVLGASWATYVYPQMPLTSLLPANYNKEMKDQRTDFFICYYDGDKKIAIELDSIEHDPEEDKRRNDALESNGYKVLRFKNKDVDERAPHILNDLKECIDASSNSTLVPFSEKHLIACKVVHQITIAIVKMLEEERISSHCNLKLEISDNDLFSSEEKKLLLIIAVEEAQELLENFAELYGVDLDLDFFDESAEKYWIKIGDGDNNRNTIVIRDIVLPINYLCSIRQFALEMPEKNAVSEDILRYFLQYVYGYDKFRDGQFLAIRRALCQEESIVLLPTGSGKSVIYQLSSMLLPGITVVISPLRALIEDQVSNLADRGIYNVAAIYSADEDSKKEMLKKAKAIMNNHSAMMLYIAPERMQMPEFGQEIRSLLRTNNFCLVAIDEAHCVSEWGHEFRAAYLQIGRSSRDMFKKEWKEKEFVPSIIALTGTASDNVLKDVQRDLEIFNPDAIISPPSFNRPELHYSIIPCDSNEKYTNINNLIFKSIPEKFNKSSKKFLKLSGDQTASGIIFTAYAAPKRAGNYDAWSLFNELSKNRTDLKIGTYFSKVPPHLDEKSGEEVWKSIIKNYAKEFKNNQKQLLVATKAFGMGIDKPNIRYVIHNNLSNSIEQYYQEVGRAGRDRKHAECVMLFSNSGSSQNEEFLNPNLEWAEFIEKHKNAKKSQDDDISTLMFFHNNSFKGPQHEKDVMFAVLKCLRTKSCGFKDFRPEYKVKLTETEIKSKENSDSTKDEFENDTSKDSVSNNIAKAIIRLITLGVLLKYEYDYSKKCYSITCGSLKPENVLNHYETFVERCSPDKLKGERKILDEFYEKNKTKGQIDVLFTAQVAERYVDLVYGTIEKGRRRALHSMYRLAKDASSIDNPIEQDNFIRNTIENYLVPNDSVDAIKDSETFDDCVQEIIKAHPLYQNKVIVDPIEKENATKAHGYATRMLESTKSRHPGILYINAITAIKSLHYHDNDVVNDIIEAYINSKDFSSSPNEAIEFLIQVMNLTFNASGELFELLWNKLDELKEPDLKNLIVNKVMKLSNDDISEEFKDYLPLHIATQSLRKMIGDK